MGYSFVYNTGEEEQPKQELQLNFGVFIDGTLNNKENTRLRNLYGRTNDEGRIDQSITNKEIEDKDNTAYKTIPNRDRINALQKKQAEYNSNPQKPNLTEAEADELKNYPEKDRYLVASHRDGLDSGGLDKAGTNNSYSNDYTNVARMFNACTDDYKIYIEGMGTTNQNRDDQDGFAYGAGYASGIRARVRKACEKLAEKIKSETDKNVNKPKELTKITIDVFGFSRGAAAARNFLYEINTKNAYYATKVGEYQVVDKEALKRRDQEKRKIPQDNTRNQRNDIFLDTKNKPFKIAPLKELPTPKKMQSMYVDSDGQVVNPQFVVNDKLPKRGHFALCMLELGIVENEEALDDLEIIFRFAGLYDTVSSYGELGTMGDDNTELKGANHLANDLFDDDEPELHLQKMGFLQQIVHFTAQNEHRENFASTRVVGANKKDGEGNQRIVERNFPGVHCDIGGAYENELEEVDEIETSKFLVSTTLNAYKTELIEQHWFNENQIAINFQNNFLNSELSYYKLTGKRELKKEYSYLPLHFMEEYCKPLLTKKYLPRDLTRDYAITGNTLLEDAKAYIKKHIIDDGNEWIFKTDTELETEKQNKLTREKLEKDKKEGKLEDNNEKVKDGIQPNKPKFDYDKQVQFEKEEKKRHIEQAKQEAEKRRTWVTSADHNGTQPTEQKTKQQCRHHCCTKL